VESALYHVRGKKESRCFGIFIGVGKEVRAQNPKSKRVKGASFQLVIREIGS